MRPDEDPDEPQRVFRNRIEALAHAAGAGLRDPEDQALRRRKAGHLRLQADKSITAATSSATSSASASAKPSEAADNGAQHARKLELEIVRLQQDIREKDFKQAVAEGKYIARDAVQMEIASHAALFDAGLSHAVETRAAACEEALHLIPEKHERVAYIRRWFREFLGEQLNEFANLKSYQVLMLDTAAELEDAGSMIDECHV